MGQFVQMLEKRGLKTHDSRTLWKYNLSDADFQGLKSTLKNARHLANVDPKDCALYYAEWWKRCYEGGFPSKQEVFKSFRDSQLFDAEDFFRWAKKGATMLGIRWTRHIHTLYFKTLLQQGGLPLLHIRKNNGAYKTFLLRILALRPQSVDDFAFDPALTSLLPLSSRNDQVYECCLAIVQAILAEDKNATNEGVLGLLNQENELSEIVRALRVEKQRVAEKKIHRKLRASWVLEPEHNQIRFYLSIPEMSRAELLAISGSPDADADVRMVEYRLFYNDFLLCKIVRRSDDMYRPVWVNQNALLWENDSLVPQLYLIDTEGNRYDWTTVIRNVPRLDRPTLWTQYSEKEFLLARGNNTEEEEAYLLGPEACGLITCEQTALMEINGNCLYWIRFSGERIVRQNGKSYRFSTHCPGFQWEIREDKPAWMRSSGMKVVRRKPDIRVLNGEGQAIGQAAITWKGTGDPIWQDSGGPMPLGVVHLRIQVGEAVEYDKCYNIGTFDIAFEQQGFREATLAVQSAGFDFSVKEDKALLQVAQEGPGRFKMQLTGTEQFPADIDSGLSLKGQRVLRFSLCSPFRGVALVDKDQCILPPEKKLSVSKLYGYRLLTNEDDVSVRLRNSSNPVVTSIHKVYQRVTPLSFFADKVNHLLRLSSSGQPAVIEIEICVFKNGRYRVLNTFIISRYEAQIVFCRHPDKAIAQRNPSETPLWAILMDGPAESATLQALEPHADGWVLFPEKEFCSYLVFGVGLGAPAIEPTQITFGEAADDADGGLMPEEFGANQAAAERRRVTELAESLLQEAPESATWRQLNGYYRICLEHGLAFSSFDLLRCLSYSGELAAKAFIYLLCYGSEEFDTTTQKRLEEDLCFYFHWISKNDWGYAMFWMGCFSAPELMAEVTGSITGYFGSFQPSENFKAMARWIQEERTPSPADFHLNVAVQGLRTRLGEQVLNVLPAQCPAIGEGYKNLIPVNNDNYRVKILLKAPLAVALSITGAENSLWGAGREAIRRNIQYCYELDPTWYAQAICYCLNSIKIPKS